MAIKNNENIFFYKTQLIGSMLRKLRVKHFDKNATILTFCMFETPSNLIIIVILEWMEL